MTTGSPQPNLVDTAQREKYTFRIGLWTGILFVAISIVSIISTIQTGLYAFGGIILTGVIAAISFAAAYLARRGRSSLGSAILVSSILLLSLSLPLLAKGQGISLAILTVILVSSIASYTLSAQWAIRATITSVGIGLLVIFADIFLPDFGIPNDPLVTNIISAVAGLIYAIVILRRFNTYPLRTKLIIAFIVITLIPIIILSVYNNYITRDILNQQAVDNLNKLATENAQKIDTYVSAQLDTVRTEAQQPSLGNYLQAGSTNKPEAEANASRSLLTFVRKDPIFILSYAILDTHGITILSTDQSQLGQDESRYEYFTSPILDGVPHISNLIFKSDYPTIYFSAPIRAENGSIIGVLRAEYYASVFQSIVNSTASGLQAGQQLVLVDQETLLRIASTSEREKIYRSFRSISPQQVIALQSQQKFPPGIYTIVLSPSFEFTRGIENIASRSTFTLPTDERNNNIFVIGRMLSTQPWVVTAQQSEKIIYAQAGSQAQANTLWALGLTTFAFIAAISVSQVVTRPVVALANVAEEITRGNLAARSDIATNDEVGRLSQVFNNMTAQLSQTLAGLEQSVEERTTALQTANEQSAQRARQLQSIADVSKIITREQSISKLLPLITDVVSERFGYYHIGIFLLDEARRAAVLQASNSAGGKRMVANSHTLVLGTGSIVGYAALTGKPRIALDVGEDAVFFNNPNLPETHSEMALPLVVRGTTIGILDMQSKQSGAFTQEDVDTLSILADQVAIAIENARLFRQTQTALEESQAVVQSFLRQEWSALSRKQSTVGYVHAGTGGKALTVPVKSDEIEQAIRGGGVIKKENKSDETASPTLAIPIKLGEQVMGAIRIQSPDKNRNWSTEEINLLRSISERVGLALENARLVASSQKRASKERTIGEISTKISAATDMDTILRTAVQEIGRTLSGADVVIQLQESQEE